MQCKLCTFNHSSQDVLLKHYRLHHYRGRSWQQPCVYTECVCTFKTEGALKSHLSRAHRKPVSDEGHFTFKCELCDFKNVCQPSQFIKHLRNLLKACDTVQCPFKDCNLKTNVLSSQTDSSLQQEKEALCVEMKKKNPNLGLVQSKMEMTFSPRRKEIAMEEPLVFDVLKQWPALFLPEQILLDDQATGMVAQRKSAALKGLPLVMREDSQKFLRTCLETEPPENLVGGMKMGVLTIVEDDVGTVESNPNIRFFPVVLEEQIVVDEVSDLPTAVALLFGLVYALNMEYPKEL